MKVISKLLVMLLLVGGSVYAQDRPARRNMNTEDRVKEHTERLVKEHNLSDEQRERVEALNREHFEAEKLQREKQDAAERSKEERERLQEERRVCQESYHSKMKEILTPQQYEEYVKKKLSGKKEEIIADKFKRKKV